MSDKSRKPKGAEDAFDLDALLHPARAFAHPNDVLNDPDLTLREKRSILSAWASDACAAEPPPGTVAVPFDEIMSALHTLDRQVGEGRPRPHYRSVLEERIPGVFGRKTRDDGQSLH